VAEILGVGLTHYPPLLGSDEEMSWVLRWTLDDPDIPAEVKPQGSWPDAMRREWAGDEGLAAAATHRAALMDGFGRVRQALDEFAPDVVVIFGDDQYENFREDLIPPFAVLAYDDMDTTPWTMMKRRRGSNIWNEPDETVFRIRGAREIGKHLVGQLIERGFDMPYAYTPLHQQGLSHSFLNALLLLDNERMGLPYQVLPVSVNCYGSAVVSRRGSLSRFADLGAEPDPPAPTPARCMDLGAAIADVLLDSPWRVGLMASSSWSHAFLTDHTWRLYPDQERDRMLYEALDSGDYRTWREQTTADLTRAGQQELLNWFCLAGAMERCSAKPSWATLIDTHIFNSNKVFAVYPPITPHER
jgi:hypothetical protein